MGGLVWAAMDRGAERRVLRGAPAGVDLGVLVDARALGAHVVQQVFDRKALLLVRPDGEQVGAVVVVAGLVVVPPRSHLWTLVDTPKAHSNSGEGPKIRLKRW